MFIKSIITIVLSLVVSFFCKNPNENIKLSVAPNFEFIYTLLIRLKGGSLISANCSIGKGLLSQLNYSTSLSVSTNGKIIYLKKFPCVRADTCYYTVAGFCLRSAEGKNLKSVDRAFKIELKFGTTPYFYNTIIQGEACSMSLLCMTGETKKFKTVQFDPIFEENVRKLKMTPIGNALQVEKVIVSRLTCRNGTRLIRGLQPVCEFCPEGSYRYIHQQPVTKCQQCPFNTYNNQMVTLNFVKFLLKVNKFIKL